jgi:UDP-GlcNAc:undecaprenyl-phosphate GlcNAc-1-phosphate transferase
MTVNEFFAAAASFVVTLAAIAALRHIAFRIDLVDRPGGHKTHHGEVPIIGGLGMFLGIVTGIGLLDHPIVYSGPLLSAISLLVLLGLLDDRFSLSPWTRLPVQATAAIVAMYGTHTFVTTLGAPFGSELHLNHFVSPVITVVLMVASINAFNMLDGMDGLAGIVAAITFAALGYMAHRAGLPVSPYIAIVVIASVLAFLVFNAPLIWNNRIRCFMGDAGSTFLGLAVAWIGVRLSQAAGERSVAPVTVLWLVALPLFELLWTFGRRLLKGQSPFRGDTQHFHHLMIRGGFSVRGAFFMFALLATLLAVAGIILEIHDAADSVSLLLLLSTGIVVMLSIRSARIIRRFMPSALVRDDSTHPSVQREMQIEVENTSSGHTR